MKPQLLLPAAGMGSRLGLVRPKALVDLAGKPMVVRTLDRFQPLDLVSGAVIIVPPGRQAEFDSVLNEGFPGVRFVFAEGGAQRQQSVANGLEHLDADTEIVVVHDAARPFVSPDSVQASIDAARQCGAATVAVPVSDTILVAGEDQYLEDTPDRGALWACQTPQTFQVSVIRQAHHEAWRNDFIGTDDASLVRRIGGRVKLVMGTALNFKVTTPDDLLVASRMDFPK